jgi:hypothetical protein
MILKFAFCHSFRWMRISMTNVERLTPEEIDSFLRGSKEMQFAGQSR